MSKEPSLICLHLRSPNKPAETLNIKSYQKQNALSLNQREQMLTHITQIINKKWRTEMVNGNKLQWSFKEQDKTM